MADTAVAITAGAGTNIDTRTEGTNGNHRQVVVLGDPATNAGVAPVDATAGLKVNLGSDNDVTVTGTVDLGATDNAVLDAIQSGTSRLTSSASTIDPDTALATTALQVGAQYNATPPTFTDGEQGGLQITAAGRLITSDPVLANVAASEYETVAASQTGQVLGATGGTGDYLSHLLVIPATTSPGAIAILDNATSITVFTGGASSVTNLVPFVIPLGMTSVGGAWSVTTGAAVSVVAVGNFT